MSRLRQLGKDSLIYGFGGAVGKGISFFLLPIYTRIFTPADYGMIEMMSVIVSLLTAILTMGMDSAQSFFFFEQREEGKQAQKQVVTAILQWRLTWGLGIVAITGAAAPLINTWFFGGQLPWMHFGVSFAGALFATVMTQSVEIFRLLYKPWSYIGIIVSRTVLAAGLTLFFVLALEQGIFSFFLGSAVSAFVLAWFGWIRVRDYLDFSTRYHKWWPRLLRFGAPLLPAGLAIYVMNTADRWFIQHYHGEDALGLYAVGAKFVLLMALAVDMFRKAWWPMAMDAMHSNDGPATFRMIARLFMGLGSAAVVYLAFLSPRLIRWLTAPAYHGAYPIVGVLAWKAVFYGFYLVGSPGIWKAERTYLSAFLMAGAGMLNFGLNWIFVPLYGGVGAALSTSISYFVLVVVAVSISEHLWKINFPYALLLTQVVLGTASMIWLMTTAAAMYVQVLVAHLTVAVLLLSAFDKTNRRTIVSLFHYRK